MIELLFGVGGGVVLAIIVGILVWRNNKSKWNMILDKIETYIDAYDNIDALKAALQDLLNKLRV